MRTSSSSRLCSASTSWNTSASLRYDSTSSNPGTPTSLASTSGSSRRRGSDPATTGVDSHQQRKAAEPLLSRISTRTIAHHQQTGHPQVRDPHANRRAAGRSEPINPRGETRHYRIAPSPQDAPHRNRIEALRVGRSLDRHRSCRFIGIPGDGAGVIGVRSAKTSVDEENASGPL